VESVKNGEPTIPKNASGLRRHQMQTMKRPSERGLHKLLTDWKRNSKLLVHMLQSWNKNKPLTRIPLHLTVIDGLGGPFFCPE